MPNGDGTLLATLRRVTPEPLRPLLGRLRRALMGQAVPSTPTSSPALEVAPDDPDALVAPRAMWALVGAADADYVRVGEEFRQLFIASGLQPDHAFLDVGCGIGRAAAPLVDYLSPHGLYRGFDVMAEAIAWCNERIGTDPRFQFLHADLHSDRYNPGGTTLARDYVFPYADGTFDFVWLGSVFTHMLAADQARFASEIARVLKPGGISVISYYLIDEEARAKAGSPDIAFDFAHALEDCWTATPDLPESVIAYEIERVLAQYDSLGFDVTEQRLGVWRREALQDQDILVARKR